MSRDVVTTERYALYEKREYLWSGEYITSQYGTKMYGSHRYRGDLVHSDHISPTAYRAHRFEAKPEFFRYEKYIWTSVGWRKNHYEGYWRNARTMGSLDGKPWDVSFPSGLVNQAKTQALNKMSKHDFNLGQFAGEMPETLRFLRSNFLSAMAAYKSLRHGNIRLAAKHLGVSWDQLGGKGTASKYLATIFGWKPLIEESYKLYQTATSVIKGDVPLTVKSTAITDYLQTPSDPRYKASGGGLKGVEVGLTYEVLDPRIAEIASLGLTNPLALAWELVPSSFVINWFLPIGQFLDAIDAHLGLGFKTGYVTKFGYGDVVIEDTAGFYGYTMVKPMHNKVKTFGMDRSVLYSWPRPNIWVGTGINNFGKSLTATALALTRLK